MWLPCRPLSLSQWPGGREETELQAPPSQNHSSPLPCSCSLPPEGTGSWGQCGPTLPPQQGFLPSSDCCFHEEFLLGKLNFHTWKLTSQCHLPSQSNKKKRTPFA